MYTKIHEGFGECLCLFLSFSISAIPEIVCMGVATWIALLHLTHNVCLWMMVSSRVWFSPFLTYDNCAAFNLVKLHLSRQGFGLLTNLITQNPADGKKMMLWWFMMLSSISSRTFKKAFTCRGGFGLVCLHFVSSFLCNKSNSFFCLCMILPKEYVVQDAVKTWTGLIHLRLGLARVNLKKCGCGSSEILDPTGQTLKWWPALGLTANYATDHIKSITNQNLRHF